MSKVCLSIIIVTVTVGIELCHLNINNGITKIEAPNCLLQEKYDLVTDENRAQRNLKEGDGLKVDKKEALGFLHRRHKMRLKKECFEERSWEELKVHFEPNDQKSGNYTFNYNCGPLSCQASFNADGDSVNNNLYRTYGGEFEKYKFN